MAEKKLFLLDAYALIYRAYFAFSKNHRINSKGQNTSAVLGFTNTLYELLKKENPTHIAIAFDSPEETIRHDDFSGYKANRESMPEDLAASIPHIFKVIEGFNIPVIMKGGYEADDIIGTLAKKAEENGFTTYMMTPDKDFGQLVSENIFMYKPARMGNKPEVLGVPEICEKHGINRPEQLIDILGLWGDASDNIPGVPGVGEKRASELIQAFDSIENLYENTDKLKGKLKENVENNKEKAFMSKQLATIILDVPVEFNEEGFERQKPRLESLKEIFEEMEFRALSRRILGELSKSGDFDEKDAEAVEIGLFAPLPESVEDAKPQLQKKNINTTKHQYHLIDTSEKRKELAKKLLAVDSFCFDTETTGVDPNLCELIGISFSFKVGEAYYVNLPEDYNKAVAVISDFKEVLENTEIEKTGQNIKYDIAVLKWYDINVKGKIFDTMLAHYLLQPDMRHNMDLLAETYLDYIPVSIESLIGKKGKNQGSLRDVSVETVKDYACEDADITLQLRDVFLPMLRESEAFKLFEEIELPLVAVLASMEAEGVNIDSDNLISYSKKLEKEIITTEKFICDLAGTEFNVASPKQLGEVLFERLKITDKPKLTKTKQYATSEEVLTKLIGKHPIVEHILEYRSLAKLKGTYVDPLPGMLNPRTHRLHTSFNQAVAATGRLSSNNPNLQNIPIRTERGREIRKAFIPRNKNFVLLAADYSQIELRIIAGLSKDENMVKDFIEGRDVHTATAARVYDIDIEEVSSDMRRNAKMVNFGIIYGISAFGLSQRLGIKRGEASEIINQYFEKYSGIKQYMEDSVQFARENGYVETIMKRRRYLRDINSNNSIVRGFAERNAVNAPIQGSAADIIKIAMINIFKEISKQNLRSKMILQVHDELVFDVHKDEIDTIKKIVNEKMCSAYEMGVPLEIDMNTGVNWLEAH